MSEPTPASIPASATRGPPPRKKPRHIPPSASASTAQASHIEDLMYYHDPEQNNPLILPSGSDSAKATVAAPPEIVANVQGSSAGAGSGEFHVYKASRRREYERLRTMEEESLKEEQDGKWGEDEQKRREADEEKTRRNREKRQNRKKRKGGKDGSVDTEGDNEGEGLENHGKGKKDIKLRQITNDKDAGEDEDGGGTNGAGPSTGVALVMKKYGITIHDDD